MTVELAEFGVIVRTILPGISATRIFTKIDRGDSIPDARWPAETVPRISPFCGLSCRIRRLRQLRVRPAIGRADRTM